MDLLAGLNVDQVNAVTSRAKSILVVAGPGTGKTRALTHRIAYLIQERGVSPHNVLALTFTRKAAQEMKQRIAELLDTATANKIWIGTFHAISLRILEEFGERIGYHRHIGVYDEIDQKDILSAIIAELGKKDLKPGHCMGQLQGYASDCDKFDFDKDVRLVVTEYWNRLKSYNAVDYSLLLTEALKLIRKHADIHRHYNEKFRYVFVDEYQDTDRTQYYLHEAIKPENICVVGDCDQNIYGWRGSDINIILDFEKNHTDAEVVKLDLSYRCTDKVIDAANSLISHNTARIENYIGSEKEGVPVDVIFADTVQGECSVIANAVYGHPGQCAILTRTHGQHAAIAEALTEQNIPHKIIGAEQNFWRTEGTRMVISVLKVLHNNRDDYHFRRIAKDIIWKLSDTEALEFEVRALRVRVRAYDLLISPENETEHSKKFLDLVEWYNLNRDKPLKEIVERILKAVDLIGFYAAQDRITKAQQLSAIDEHVAAWQLSQSDVTVASFLQWLAAQEVQSEVDDSDTVKVATIHAVKGLEFSTVVLAGMNEGKLPHGRAITEGHIEEERRLCYVAMTRAIDRLYLTSAGSETVRGKSRPLERSRFIYEMETQ